MLTKKTKKIYLIGIKGTGMSSLAVLLKNMGYKVAGSDTKEKFFTESQLKKNRIRYYEAYNVKHVAAHKPDLVVYSTAYNDSNPEIAQAKRLKIPLFSYPEAVGWISGKLNSVAVCGSHGKTTTTSMLAWIMESTGHSAALVGTASELNRAPVKPKYFIFEADEYQNKFQYYSPANVILTNIDYDHPDFFKTPAQYLEVFKEFTTRILKSDGYILYCRDDKSARKLLSRTARNSESYGFDAKCGWRIKDVSKTESSFSIYRGKKKIIDILLSVYGRHNILNATSAAVMALRLGVPKNKIAERLKTFTGAKRRMELIHSKKYLIIDDYGHHPTEIRATLSALRSKYPSQKIIAVFHPHTFTRTKNLLKEFSKSFKKADLVIVLDIYASAREIQGTIHSRDVVRELKKSGSKAIYIPTIPETAKYIKNNVPQGALILTIGAGNVWQIHKLIQ